MSLISDCSSNFMSLECGNTPPCGPPLPQRLGNSIPGLGLTSEAKEVFPVFLRPARDNPGLVGASKGFIRLAIYYLLSITKQGCQMCQSIVSSLGARPLGAWPRKEGRILPASLSAAPRRVLVTIDRGRDTPGGMAAWGRNQATP